MAWQCWYGKRGGVVAVSEEHEYMGGTCGSGIVSSADDVLEMSLVRALKGVCICLARGRVGERIALCFTNPVGTEALWEVCVFGCSGVGGVGGMGV